MSRFLFAALLSLTLVTTSCEPEPSDPETNPPAGSGTTEAGSESSGNSETGATDRVVEVDVAEAAELLEGDDGVGVLDIRTPGEFADGHIEGAINVDFRADDFEARLEELDRDRPYVMHCASGGRSGKALSTFRELEFDKIYHLAPGMRGWRAEGLPAAEE